MGFNFEGFGENADLELEGIARRKALREKQLAKERPTYQANNILCSLGRRANLFGKSKKISFKGNGLWVEGVYQPDKDIADTCQKAHDYLIGKELSDVVFELRIFFKERGKKVLKYYSTLGVNSKLHIYEPGSWQDKLTEVSSRKNVKYHPLPAGVMHKL